MVFCGSWGPTWLQKPPEAESGGGDWSLFLGLEGLGGSWRSWGLPGLKADFLRFVGDFHVVRLGGVLRILECSGVHCHT